VTSGAYSTVCAPNGGTCAAAHVTKLNPSGSAILWSTYVGDARSDGGDALFYTGPIQLDGNGNVYIMGQSNPGFPLVNPVEAAPTLGSLEVLVAELDPTGSKLLFSTPIGSNGLHTASPAGLAVDSTGDIYLAGNQIGQGLITTPGAFETTSNDSNGCCYHGFVAKIAPAGATVATSTTGQVEPFAAESIVTAWGVDMVGETFQVVTLPLPTSLDGNALTVTDSANVVRPAPLFYIAPGQINFEIPPGTALGTAKLTVQNQNGSTQTGLFQIGAVSPGIYPLNPSGLAAALALPVVSGTQLALQPVWQLVSGSVLALPVSLGPSTEQVYLELYGTGFRNAKSITATVGGVSVPILGWAAQGQYVGEDQVNIGPLPRSLAGAGNVNIVITADGKAANTVNVTIQ
jgi:uncharacterized protein (TIGR03437 family)